MKISEHYTFKVDHYRFHLWMNSLCFALCLALWALEIYYAIVKEANASLGVGVVLSIATLIVYVVTVIGILDPNRMLGLQKKGPVTRYEDLKPEAKRQYVSSMYTLWGVIALAVSIILAIVALR
jgi:Na+-transporting methylmalonyl-CoA/oxaloacetate decarboxylase gamma subunit